MFPSQGNNLLRLVALTLPVYGSFRGLTEMNSASRWEELQATQHSMRKETYIQRLFVAKWDPSL